MKHSVEELFRLRSNESGKVAYCTREYLNFHGLEVTPREQRRTAKLLIYPNLGGLNGDRARIYDVDGARTVFPYGAYYWFDEQEERDVFKKEAQAEREEFLKWNKIKKAIIAKLDDKSQEELEVILASL